MGKMTYEEYLAHHGILGMRWGKRNGPPYPLEPSQMSPKERVKNDIAEYSAKTRLTRRKEKEQVRKARFKEREAIRQNKVDEREGIRQNKVDEKEWIRQNKVLEDESRRQYKKGRTYVRNALLGIGLMSLTSYGIAKFVAKGKAKRGA